VFLDDVEVSDDALVGAEGEGWSVATSTLTHERTSAMLGRHATTAAAAARVAELALRPGVPASLRDRCLAAWSEAQLFRLTGYRGVAESTADRIAVPAFTQRLQWGLLNRRLFELGVELHGAFGMLAGGDAAHDEELATWSRLFLAARGWTIGGGTSEIQRNMLAERVLRLPR
jgi:alkylation response protein AidB-like acyl-CoA dehydrogenase